MTTSADRLTVLREQFALTWSLAEIVIADLTDDECLRSPSPHSWTVRRDGRGRWVPDWEEPAPDDLAQPSLAWTMWQTLWWWSVLLDRVEGPGTLERTDVLSPGAVEGVAELGRLRRRWEAVLASLEAADLDAGTTTTFPFGDDRPFAHVVAWATVELTKNIAEMGVLRRLARAGGLPLE